MKLYKLYWHWATSCFAIDQSTTLNLGEYNECCVSLPHSVMRALDWECPLFSLEMFRRWRRRTPIQFSPEPELPSPDSPRRPNPDHTGARSESLSDQSSEHKLLSFPYNYKSPPFPPLKRVLISHYDIKYEILLLLGRHPIPKRMKFQKSFKGGGVVISLSQICIANLPSYWGYIWPWYQNINRKQQYFFQKGWGSNVVRFPNPLATGRHSWQLGNLTRSNSFWHVFENFHFGMGCLPFVRFPDFTSLWAWKFESGGR